MEGRLYNLVNIIERKLGSAVRMRIKNVIATGLGLFLALRFNDYLRNIVATYVPDDGSLVFELMVLIILTVVVVYIIQKSEELLDGK
jgi:hypothetical protein